MSGQQPIHTQCLHRMTARRRTAGPSSTATEDLSRLRVMCTAGQLAAPLLRGSGALIRVVQEQVVKGPDATRRTPHRQSLLTGELYSGSWRRRTVRERAAYSREASRKRRRDGDGSGARYRRLAVSLREQRSAVPYSFFDCPGGVVHCVRYGAGIVGGSGGCWLDSGRGFALRG